MTGAHCELYRRCYEASRLCYQTDYGDPDSLESSTAQCLRQDSFILPVMLYPQDVYDLRDFIATDPAARLGAGPAIWLAAETQPLPLDNNTAVKWEWLGATPTSTSQPITCQMVPTCKTKTEIKLFVYLRDKNMKQISS